MCFHHLKENFANKFVVLFIDIIKVYLICNENELCKLTYSKVSLRLSNFDKNKVKRKTNDNNFLLQLQIKIIIIIIIIIIKVFICQTTGGAKVH